MARVAVVRGVRGDAVGGCVVKIIEAPYLSAAWREYRAKRITGSTAAAILGVDSGSYARSALTEWARIRGHYVERDETNAYSEWGMATEPVHRAWLDEDGLGAVRVIDGIVQHPTLDWACATLDGITGDGDALCDVELKAPSQYTADEWRSGIPLKYQVQSQFGMACAEARQAYLSAILPPQRDPGAAFVRLAAALAAGTAMEPSLLKWCGFERVGHVLTADARFQAAMFAKLAQFMDENVRQGFAPEATGLACDKDYLKNRETGEPLATEFDERAVALWDELQAVNAEANKVDERKQSIQNRLVQIANAATWTEAKKAISKARRLTA